MIILHREPDNSFGKYQSFHDLDGEDASRITDGPQCYVALVRVQSWTRIVLCVSTTLTSYSKPLQYHDKFTYKLVYFYLSYQVGR